RPATLVPLVSGLGALFGLTLWVGRSEQRFVLPLGFFLAVHAGVAAAALARHRAIAAVLVAFALAGPVSLAVAQIGEVRRDVEAGLTRQRGDPRAETYGRLVSQPRFSTPAAARVGTEPVDKRDPMPGMTEVLGVPGDAPARAPDAIVLTEGFARPYL